MKKRLMIIIPAAVALIAIAAAFAYIKFTPKENIADVASMMQTAQKYLLDNNYEQAIIEFKKIIEIEPKNAEAYLGLAEAYEKSGDIEAAIETLEKALEFSDSPRVTEMLDRLRGMTLAEAETVTTAAETSIAEVKEEFITIKGEQYSTLLTELELNVKELTDEDIKDLSKMVNLTWLDFASNQISDISPLANLTNLYWLNLSNNQISDISALKNLTNLKYLYLNDNQISDITPLANLENLDRLVLDDNQISNISPLNNLKNLRSLDLNFNPISDISPLANLTNLYWVHLSNAQISDISALKNLTNLDLLELGYNQISDISPLANLTNLEMLHLSSNRISNISPLANLSNLENLELDYNQISDISALKNLTNLKYLYLYNNKISSSDVEELKTSLPDCVII